MDNINPIPSDDVSPDAESAPIVEQAEALHHSQRLPESGVLCGLRSGRRNGCADRSDIGVGELCAQNGFDGASTKRWVGGGGDSRRNARR